MTDEALMYTESSLSADDEAPKAPFELPLNIVESLKLNKQQYKCLIAASRLNYCWLPLLLLLVDRSAASASCYWPAVKAISAHGNAAATFLILTRIAFYVVLTALNYTII